LTATRLSPPEVELVSRHLTRARRQVKYNGRVWSVERRFSEFDELDKELARMPAREGRTVHLPPFPSKVWVGKAAQETQDRRRRELEAYVQALERPRTSARSWSCRRVPRRTRKAAGSPWGSCLPRELGGAGMPHWRTRMLHG
jgi:hypothetical protein